MRDIQDWHLFQWGTQRYQNYLRTWIPAAIVIGFTAGLLMSLFVLFIELIGLLIVNSIGLTFGIPIAIVLAGGITAILAKKGYTEVEGSGIGYLIEHKNKQQELNGRIIGTRFLASGASLGAGMSGGREGPAMLIGGTIAYILGKKILKLNAEDLSLAITLGGAASTSAIFQAPLGGTIFASEVPYRRDIDIDVYVPAFIASITATIVFILFGKGFLQIEGFKLISIITQALPIDIYWITLMVIFGFVIGLFSLVYTFLFNRLIYIFHRISEAWERILLSAIVLAIFIVLSGVFFPEIPIAATGFEFLELLSVNEEFRKLEIVFILLLIKATIILFVIGGGNAVGIFSPTLVLGALVGTLFAIITGQTEQIGIFFILGMSGSSKTSF